MHLAGAKHLATLAGWRYDYGLECGEQANTAKYLAAEASYFAADQAVQTHGGLGYATEYHVERYWREARLQRLAPVSQEMTCNFVAQSVLGLPRSY
jgi:acyl-CoA dehydrogenase